MKSEKLDFHHKELLYEKLRKIHEPASEYSFSNLYLFRKTHDYEVIFDKDIFIKGKTHDGKIFLMPTSEISSMDINYIKEMAQSAEFLFPIPERHLSKFDPNEFEYSFNEGDSDYIYTIEKMRLYPGRHLQNKRNLLKQFVRDYESQAVPLTQDKINDAIAILEQWQKDVEQPPEDTDYFPCLEALQKYDEVVLCGYIYYVNGEPGGFVMGEEINPEMFVLHFAKGKKIYKGLYQYMYNSFANILPDKYKFLNFEQDLGKLALKIAKSSYIPDMMIKKYLVRLKNKI